MVVNRKVTEKELFELARNRKRDRAQSRTKRRIATESRPKPVAELISQLFAHDAEAMRRMEETRALMAWVNYVGESAGRVSEAIRVRNGTLVVRVCDPLWMQQLSLLKRDLVRRYMKDFPKLAVRDIFFTRN